MARCDEGYRCAVCGADVEAITESLLYLRYVLGEVPLERLHIETDCHVRCNPAISQYIVDADFPPVTCEGLFSKDACDPDFVHSEEERVSAGWRRLQAIPTLGISVMEYPLA